MQNTIKKQAEKIANHNEKLKIKGRIVIEKNAYWIKNDNASKEGPFCSGCWDNDDKKQLIHLHSRTESRDTWVCPVCKVGVTILTTSTSLDSSPHIIPRENNG